MTRHKLLFLLLIATAIGAFFAFDLGRFLNIDFFKAQQAAIEAYLVGALQILVYAGAIVVLFLFVVMLLGAEQLRGKPTVGVGSWQLPLSVVLALALLATFGYIIVNGAVDTGVLSAEAIASGPVEIGLALFESYVFPFEVASVLLLTAMVGVVVLRAKRGSNA